MCIYTYQSRSSLLKFAIDLLSCILVNSAFTPSLWRCWNYIVPIRVPFFSLFQLNIHWKERRCISQRCLVCIFTHHILQDWAMPATTYTLSLALFTCVKLRFFCYYFSFSMLFLASSLIHRRCSSLTTAPAPPSAPKINIRMSLFFLQIKSFISFFFCLCECDMWQL